MLNLGGLVKLKFGKIKDFLPLVGIPAPNWAYKVKNGTFRYHEYKKIFELLGIKFEDLEFIEGAGERSKKNQEPKPAAEKPESAPSPGPSNKRPTDQKPTKRPKTTIDALTDTEEEFPKKKDQSTKTPEEISNIRTQGKGGLSALKALRGDDENE